MSPEERERRYRLAFENQRRAETAERALVERMEAVEDELASMAAYRRSQSLDDAATAAFDYSAQLVRVALSARPEAARGEGER